MGLLIAMEVFARHATQATTAQTGLHVTQKQAGAPPTFLAVPTVTARPICAITRTSILQQAAKESAFRAGTKGASIAPIRQ